MFEPIDITDNNFPLLLLNLRGRSDYATVKGGEGVNFSASIIVAMFHQKEGNLGTIINDLPILPTPPAKAIHESVANQVNAL